MPPHYFLCGGICPHCPPPILVPMIYIYTQAQLIYLLSYYILTCCHLKVCARPEHSQLHHLQNNWLWFQPLKLAVHETFATVLYNKYNAQRAIVTSRLLHQSIKVQMICISELILSCFLHIVVSYVLVLLYKKLYYICFLHCMLNYVSLNITTSNIVLL